MFNSSRWQHIRKPVISALIIFHISMIFCWLFPINQFFVSLVQPFRRYLVFMGFDQDYSMFGPNPRDTNVQLLAVVTYKSGSTKVWIYPRMERLSLIDRIRKERYRKFAYDSIAWDKYRFFWPDLARYIARQCVLPNDTPELISVHRFTQSILAPDIVADDFIKERTAAATDSTLITYVIHPEDLQ
jgi:hypothetical protein